MTHRMSRKYWTIVASLALAAGSALADDGKAQGPSELDMEVIDVVEKFEPAPISKHDYFRQSAKGVETALNNELDRMLTASVNTSFEWLNDRLEARGEARMAAADDMDRLITVASATPAGAAM